MNHGQRRAATGSSDSDARQQLIDTTQKLLGSAGVQSLTSRAITDAAGVNLAAITYYFGSKQELVDESMLALARTLLTPVVEELGSDSEPIIKLLRAVQLLNQVFAANRFAPVAYLQTVSSAATGATIRESLVALIRSVEDVLGHEIRHQRETGGIPHWIDPPAMAQLIMATVHGTLIASSLEPDRIDHTRIASQFAQLLLVARTDSPENSP